MSSGKVGSEIPYEIGLANQTVSAVPTESLLDMAGDQDVYVPQPYSEQIPAEVQSDDTDSVARIKRCHRLGTSGSGFFVKRLI